MSHRWHGFSQIKFWDENVKSVRNKMNSELEDEHFASLCAGCASQTKLNRSTKAGIKILYLHFILIRPDFIIFATQNFQT